MILKASIKVKQYEAKHSIRYVVIMGTHSSEKFPFNPYHRTRKIERAWLRGELEKNSPF